MLCSRNGDISTILIFNKTAWACPNHWDENKIEFSSLRAVNWEDLVICVIFREILSNLINLSIVRSDNIDTILCEFAPRYCLEGLKAEFFQLCYYAGLLLVIKRSTSELFLTLRDIDEQERLISLYKLFIRVWDISAFYFVLVKQHIWDFH